MAVAVDNAPTTALDTAAAAGTISYASLTVGSISNGFLLAGLVQQQGVPSSVSGHWDPGTTNQALTQIGTTQVTGDFGSQVSLWGLVNPTAGNKTLTFTWTGTSNTVIYAMSFSGVNQSTPTANFSGIGSHAAGSPATNTITSATGDMVFALWSTFATISAVSNTSAFTIVSDADFKTAANYAAGAATVGLTMTNGGGFAWASVGIDIVTATVPDTLFNNASLIFMRERAERLLWPVRDLWRPKRPRLLAGEPGFVF